MSTLIETLRMRADIEARLSGTDRSGGLYLEAAALIEQQAAKIAELADDLERTRHERNFSHVQARREISKEYRDRIAELEAQIAAVAPAVDAQPVWISVDERLPENNQVVAFVVMADQQSPNWYLNRHVLGGTYQENWGFSTPGVGHRASHWMPLPEAPAALSQKDPQ